MTCVASERRQQFTNVNIIMYVTILFQFKSWRYYFQTYKRVFCIMQNAPDVDLPQAKWCTYDSMKQIALAKAKLCLDSFHVQHYFPNHCSMQILFYSMMIGSWSSNVRCFWATQIIPKSDRKKGVWVLM